MSDVTKYSEAELPTEGLRKLGFTEKDLQNLPEALKQSLLNGDVSPMFMATIRTENGKEVSIPLRAQLVTHPGDTTPALVVYPHRREIDNTLQLSSFEMERVRNGELIKKDILVDGKRENQFIQLDPRTNSLVHSNSWKTTMDMAYTVGYMETIKDIQLGQQQKQAILEGKPVELNVGDEKVTVGVSLLEPQGFKVVKGDMEEWKRNQESLYDVAHPEFMGFVKTDRNRWEYQQVLNADRDNKRDNPLRQDRQERTTSLHF